MMLSFKYATAESSSLFVLREIFISMFCTEFRSLFVFREIFISIFWSEERSRHDFIVRFSHVIFLVMQKSIKSRTLFVSVGQ